MPSPAVWVSLLSSSTMQYCKAVGAEVYGTCSDSKVEVAKSLGVKYVASSRDAKKFEADMKQFLGPNGKVDVVLNSLIDELRAYMKAKLEEVNHDFHSCVVAKHHKKS